MILHIEYHVSFTPDGLGETRSLSPVTDGRNRRPVASALFGLRPRRQATRQVLAAAAASSVRPPITREARRLRPPVDSGPVASHVGAVEALPAAQLGQPADVPQGRAAAAQEGVDDHTALRHHAVCVPVSTRCLGSGADACSGLTGLLVSLFRSSSDVHGVFHNVAYWIQGNVLSVEQRYTLYDAGYALMPELTYVGHFHPCRSWRVN